MVRHELIPTIGLTPNIVPGQADPFTETNTWFSCENRRPKSRRFLSINVAYLSPKGDSAKSKFASSSEGRVTSAVRYSRRNDLRSIPTRAILQKSKLAQEPPITTYRPLVELELVERPCTKWLLPSVLPTRWIKRIHLFLGSSIPYCRLSSNYFVFSAAE